MAAARPTAPSPKNRKGVKHAKLGQNCADNTDLEKLIVLHIQGLVYQNSQTHSNMEPAITIGSSEFHSN